MNADDCSWWLQSMGGVSTGDRTVSLGRVFGGVYPIGYTHTARSGGIWFLFGHRVEGQLTQADCARILQHIGE